MLGSTWCRSLIRLEFRACLLLLAASACFGTRASQGGGETEIAGGRGSALDRRVNAEEVALPAGYAIEVVATDLNMATGVAFDDSRNVFVLESGYAYGETFDTPRILAIGPGGQRRVVASGANPPWTGIISSNG